MPQSVREWIIVLWPAFMAACVLETLVFAGFDPHDINLFGLTLDTDAETVYSLAFLAFWAVSAVFGILTWILAQPADPPSAELESGRSGQVSGQGTRP